MTNSAANSDENEKKGGGGWRTAHEDKCRWDEAVLITEGSGPDG